MPNLSKPYSLEENKSAVVNVSAVANPRPVKYEWFKEDDQGRLHTVGPGQGRLVIRDGVLNISHVTREDAGYYTISATNEEGTTQTKIRLDVLYPPRYSLHHATFH